MSDEEDRDARVMRRWRENQLSDDSPEKITPKETAFVEALMEDWKPKLYVHLFEDIIYQDEEDTYPWGWPGWDPVAAMSSDHVVPREEAEAVPADVEKSHGLDVPGDGDLISFVATPPEKTDRMWTEPTPHREGPRHCICGGRLVKGESGGAVCHDAAAVLMGLLRHAEDG